MSGNEDGSKKRTLSIADQRLFSEDNFGLFCNPCNENGTHEEACGFCVNCGDYLCRKCVDFHKNFKATKTHVIQNKDEMQRDVKQVHAVRQSAGVCTEPCMKHPGKILEYYCELHAEIGCSVCVTLGHTTCKARYIPELSNGTTNSEEYGNLLKKINDLQKQFENSRDKSEESIIEVENRSDAYTAEVTQLGEKIIRHIRDLMQRSADIKDEYVRAMLVGLKSSKEKSEQMIAEIISMSVNLDSKKVSDNQSYVVMKQLQQNIQYFEETLRQTKIESKPTVFQFAENPEMKNVKKIKSFGTLSKYKKVVQQYEDITLYGKKDAETSHHITGLEVISDDRLAIIDSINTSVKLVDTKYKRVCEIKLHGEPWDLTNVNKEQLAVTLPNKGEIQFLSVAGGLNLEHVIKTHVNCKGICSHQDKLIVGFDSYPGMVQILDMTGHVLRKIATGLNNEELFNTPCYVTVNPQTSMVYVSDYDKETVTSVTLEGEITFVYSGDTLGGPSDLTIDEDGSVYVCGEKGIEHITGEGTRIQTLLDIGQEGANSEAIAYDKNTGKLYICDMFESLLKVFHLE